VSRINVECDHRNRRRDQSVLSAGATTAEPPFYVVRIKALAPVSIGR